MKITSKIIFPLLSILLFALIFYSCKTDSTVSTENPTSVEILPNEKYNWTINSDYFDYYNTITIIERNKFIASNNYSLRMCTDDALWQYFSPNNAVLHSVRAYFYGNDYVVFWGKRSFNGENSYMIADSGYYVLCPPPQQRYLAPAYFTERGTFFTADSIKARYYKYQNGTFTQFSFGGKDTLAYFGKVNGSLYCYKRESANIYNIYKITDSGPLTLPPVTGNNSIYTINSGIIRHDKNTTSVSYFNGADWNHLFYAPSTTPVLYEFITGSSKDSLTFVRVDTSKNITASVWDGNSFIKQTNIPANVNFKDKNYYIRSNYYEGIFYMIARTTDYTSSLKIIKVSLK